MSAVTFVVLCPALADTVLSGTPAAICSEILVCLTLEKWGILRNAALSVLGGGILGGILSPLPFNMPFLSLSMYHFVHFVRF